MIALAPLQSKDAAVRIIAHQICEDLTPSLSLDNSPHNSPLGREGDYILTEWLNVFCDVPAGNLHEKRSHVLVNVPHANEHALRLE